eukprot:334702-Amphidinium_carterae.1
MARALLHGFLAGSLPAHSQVAVMLARPPHVCREACDIEPFDDGHCACVQSVREQLVHLSETSHDLPSLVGASLLTLGSKWTCKAIRRWINIVVCSVATDVDSSWQTWGRTSWQKTEEAAVEGKRKQRRISPLLKDYVSEQAYSARAFIMNQAEHLLERGYTGFGSKTLMVEMTAFRTTLHLKAQDIEPVWSLSIDAATLGRPSKEFLFGHLSMVAGAEHCMLPPQVCMGKNVMECNTQMEREASLHGAGYQSFPKLTAEPQKLHAFRCFRPLANGRLA